MRIVAGRFKGRPLKAPGGRELRPTSDRTRESLFNILAHGIDGFSLDGVRVVDVFAGTGALGLEALSRGAAHATLVDQDRAALDLARENAAKLGAAREVTLLRLDATQLPPPALAVGAPCGLAFLDPPYAADLLTPALLGLVRRGWVNGKSVIVAEMGAAEIFEAPAGFRALDERVYGSAKLVFLQTRA